MKKKICVIGGGGFLGSHLVDELILTNKFDVHVFDYKKNYENKYAKYTYSDIREKNKLKNFLKKTHTVYHFAAQADIEESNKDIINTLDINILGTANILNACIVNNVKRIIFASSIYVYSDKGGYYRISKQTCEALIEEFCKNSKLKYTNLRFGSLYGPRSDTRNFIYKTLIQAIKNKKIVRGGDGEEIRQYIHVRDAAMSCIHFLQNKYINKNIMITGSESIKIKDLLVMINEIMNNEISINYSRDKLDSHYKVTPFNFRPNISEKYHPNEEISLGEGIIDLLFQLQNEPYDKINNI